MRFYVCSPSMLGVFLAAFVVAGSNRQDTATTIGCEFSLCVLRIDLPCGKSLALAILIWRPRRDLSG
jgi:hypothetical protein